MDANQTTGQHVLHFLGRKKKVQFEESKIKDTTMKRALIFGATGQDGSYLSELLLGKGYKVYGFARRSSNNNLHRIAHLLDDPHFTIVKGDVTDYGSVLNAFGEAFGPDEVYNLAAMSHVHVSFDEPSHTFDTVTKGALHVFEAARHYREISEPRYEPRIYQASSSEMFGSACSYGRCGPNLSEVDTGVKFQDESTPFIPQSPYAVAKVAAHHYAQLYRQCYGMHISCGILFNHESPRRGDQFVTKKIVNYIQGLQHPAIANFNNPPTKLFHKLKLGNINTQRDWGYASEYTTVMWLMLQQDTPDDYVVATGETHSVKDFLEHAFNLVGLDWQDYVDIDQDLFRPADVEYLRGDASKIKEKLGWEAKIKFEQLVSIMMGVEHK